MATRLTAKFDSDVAQYHLLQYVIPKIGTENAARIGITVDEFPSGSLCTILDHFVCDNKICVHASFGSIIKSFPISRLQKFKDDTEKKLSEGFTLERIANNHAKELGITDRDSAGCNKGADLELIHNDGTLLNIELKNGKSSMGGQITLYQKDNNEWYIPSEREVEFPQYANCVRAATYDGENFLDVVNRRVRHGINEYISSDIMDFGACHAFQSDKGVDVFHMEGWGTYAISEKGRSLGLETPSGRIAIRLRRKHGKAVAVVDFKEIEPSQVHWNLHSIDGLRKVKYDFLRYTETEKITLQSV